MDEQHVFKELHKECVMMYILSDYTRYYVDWDEIKMCETDFYWNWLVLNSRDRDVGGVKGVITWSGEWRYAR